MNNDYEYNYHDMADDLYYIDDEVYYDNSSEEEPWMGLDDSENEVLDNTGWDNYYHNLTDEISDD